MYITKLEGINWSSPLQHVMSIPALKHNKIYLKQSVKLSTKYITPLSAAFAGLFLSIKLLIVRIFTQIHSNTSFQAQNEVYNPKFYSDPQIWLLNMKNKFWYSYTASKSFSGIFLSIQLATVRIFTQILPPRTLKMKYLTWNFGHTLSMIVKYKYKKNFIFFTSLLRKFHFYLIFRPK